MILVFRRGRVGRDGLTFRCCDDGVDESLLVLSGPVGSLGNKSGPGSGRMLSGRVSIGVEVPGCWLS